MFKRGAQKKVLKRGTGRFSIESVFSKEGQIEHVRNALTRKL